MSEKAPIKWKFKRKMTGIEDGSGPQKKQNQPPPQKKKQTLVETGEFEGLETRMNKEHAPHMEIL